MFSKNKIYLISRTSDSELQMNVFVTFIPIVRKDITKLLLANKLYNKSINIYYSSGQTRTNKISINSKIFYLFPESVKLLNHQNLFRDSAISNMTIKKRNVFNVYKTEGYQRVTQRALTVTLYCYL